jgi:hypothetical protein
MEGEMQLLKNMRNRRRPFCFILQRLVFLSVLALIGMIWLAATAQAQNYYNVGSFTKVSTTGTQTIPHGLTSTPKALILWTNGNSDGNFASNFLFAFGITDMWMGSYSVAATSQSGVTTPNASRRLAAKAITIVQWGETLVAEADVSTWGLTDFTLNWTTNTGNTNYVVHFLAVGGPDVSSKVINWTMGTATGNKALSGLGFQPSLVVHAHQGYDFTSAPGNSAANAHFGLGVMDTAGNQWATNVLSLDKTAVGNTDTQRGQQTDGCIYSFNESLTVQKKASFVSMDADGFTVNFTNAASNAASQVISLALKGVNAKAGNFLKNTTPGPYVQSVSQTTNSSSTASIAFSGGTPSGNHIVLSFNTNSQSANVSSITDSNGNTYTLAAGPTNWAGTASRGYTYYTRNTGGGGGNITITITLTQSVGIIEAYALEYSNIATSNPVDQVSVGVGSGANMDSGSKTTTQADELIYGFGMSSGSSTVNSPNTARLTMNGNFAADRTVSSIGSYNVTGTEGAGDFYMVHMVTFKLSGVSQSVTGIGFQPGAVLLASFQNTTQANPVSQTRFGLGASDGSTQGSSAFIDQDNVATSNAKSIDKTNKVFVKVNNSTPMINAEASLTSMTSDGFTLNWTSNDAVATQILYLALQANPPTAVKVISFSAAEHEGGHILLHWRTGYEVDNLGFHVYREEGGRLYRLTPELVAGSALRAGSEITHRAGKSYSWIDSSITRGRDPKPKYWLEDADLNGKRTWHGPAIPVVTTEPLPEKFQSEKLSELGLKIAQKYEDYWRVQNLKGKLHQRPPVSYAQALPIDSMEGLRQAAKDPGQRSGLDMGNQWRLAGGPAIKILVNENGWYRVSIAELRAAGLSPLATPRLLQLFKNGREVPILVKSKDNRRLAPQDNIEFYGEGLDIPSTGTQVYWLVEGRRPGNPLLQYNVPGGQLGPASFAFTFELKERLFYFANLKNGEADNFFGSVVAAQPVDKILVTSHLDPAPPGDAVLEVALQGVTKGSHWVKVLLNQTEVGEVFFDGQSAGYGIWTVPQALLLGGENLVTLTSQNGEMDVSLIDLLKLTYWHTYNADSNILRFTAQGGWQVSVGGFSSPNIRMIDITDPNTPYEVHGKVTARGGEYSFTLGVPAAGLRTLLAFGDGKVKNPAGMIANQPSAWHESGNAFDFVIISHRDFLSALEPLKSRREAQGISTALVSVEDLYDEFSFGNKTPQAIKDFLSQATSKWRRPPRFVLLVGDASLDPRNYLGVGDFDFVPTKLVETVYMETAADDWYVDFNGDELPEIPVGRLAVRTAEEASTLVSKIIGYELLPGGENWSNQALLVADENKGYDFESASEAVRDLLPANVVVRKIFRSEFSNDEQAAWELFNAFNQGALLANYIGHGAEEAWGGDLFRSEDSQFLTNGLRLPFVITMTCLNGYFIDVYTESLAEALLKAKQGGAVAVWASSGLTDPSGQASLNQELIRLLFNEEPLTLGETVMRAKAAVKSPDIRRTWILFGDPTMRLYRMPSGKSVLSPRR